MTVASGRFTRQARLLTAKEYGRVFEDPIRSSDGCFTVLARANRLGHARLGMAVSKKNARRAVDRNRIKRVVRESFRWHMQRIRGLDVVVLNRQKTVKMDNAALARSLNRHWQKLAGLCADS